MMTKKAFKGSITQELEIYKKQEPRRGWSRAIKNTATQTVRLRAKRNTKNQSGYEHSTWKMDRL